MQLQPLLDLSAPSIVPHLSAMVGWLHDASNPFADWFFGSPEATRDILDEWSRRPSSELFLGRSWVLVDAPGSEPLGCLVGMDGKTLTKCRAADFVAFCEDLGSGPDADAVLEQVVSVARALFSPVDDDTFYISRVTVAPAQRGRGLGRSLVERTITAKQQEGFRKFRLDVSSDNAAAIRTYEALGLQITGTSRSDDAGLEYHAMTLAL